jgi:hypothetical protein
VTKILVGKTMSYAENQVFSCFLLNFNFKKYQKFLHLRQSLLLLLGACFWIKIDLKVLTFEGGGRGGDKTNLEF